MKSASSKLPSKTHKQILSQQQNCICGIVKAVIGLFVLIQIFVILYLTNHSLFRDSVTTLQQLTTNSLKRLRDGSTLPVQKLSDATETDPVENEKKNLEYRGFPVNIVCQIEESNRKDMPISSKEILTNLFGNEKHIVHVDFPDLKHHSSQEIRSQHPQIFKELPSYGFSSEFKNPCWWYKDEQEETDKQTLACLPYAYILGQPKSGTSDLYERLKTHQQIIMPHRKEVRWFTRGEFTFDAIPHEGDAADTQALQHRPREKLIGSVTSLYSFTNSFGLLSKKLTESKESGSKLVTIDGGPHTFWWPTQSPDGAFLPEDIPPVQLLHEIQPPKSAVSQTGEVLSFPRFIITMSNPIQRMYSDYYFLNDNLRPVRPHQRSQEKSAEQFHDRAVKQVALFEVCVDKYMKSLLAQYHTLVNDENTGQYTRWNVSSLWTGDNLELYELLSRTKLSYEYLQNFPLWFRAAQMCAHDRHEFAVGGHGRLSIGLYALFLEKWLEYFPPNAFLLLRLEDYQEYHHEHQYMEKIFKFLDIDPSSSNPDKTYANKHFNENFQEKEILLQETEKLLSQFYEPYNILLAYLAKFIENSSSTNEGSANAKELVRKFLWTDVVVKLSEKKSLEGYNGAAGGVNEEADKEKGSSDYTIVHSVREKQILEQQQSEVEDTLQDKKREKIRKIMQDHDNRESPEDQKDTVEDHTINHHGLDRFRHASIFHRKELEDRIKNEVELNNPPPPEEPPVVKHLRGPNGVELNPQSFFISNLPLPEIPINSTHSDDLDGNDFYASLDTENEKEVGKALCIAAITFNTPHLKYLLYDLGIPPNTIFEADSNRNAWHCLTNGYTYAEAHAKSYVFAELKGQDSWLRKHVIPPLPTQMHSVRSQDIMERLSQSMVKTAQWLHAAGVDINAYDRGGYTALHYACIGGMTDLVKYMITTAEADMHKYSKSEKRLPLHYALGLGHFKVGKLLVDGGSDLQHQDLYKVSGYDLLYNPGTIPADVVWKEFNIQQRATRKIPRVIHPEFYPNGGIAKVKQQLVDGSEQVNSITVEEKMGWTGGTGDWDTERLEGFEDDISCDCIDQYEADEITGEDIFNNYLARNAPVLIRGLLKDWDVKYRWTKENLTMEHGTTPVTVSDIPYANKFGGHDPTQMELHEYIEQVQEHRVVGEKHPWYVFIGNPIPKLSEKPDSIVKYENCPMPKIIRDAFQHASPTGIFDNVEVGDPKEREMFVNAQWAFGGKGTGAPVHFHNTAWAALLFGAKKWMIYPPHNMIMSNKQILDFYETDRMELTERDVKPVTCVQLAGDVMIIPESWGHGVLNVQETIAMATEFKYSLWRAKPPPMVLNFLQGNFNNRGVQPPNQRRRRPF